MTNKPRRDGVTAGAVGKDKQQQYTSPSCLFQTQATIRATVISSDRCEAERIVASGAAPVLALCHALIEAGFHPEISLEAWRGDVLCLRVRSIVEGARLRVATHGVGFEGIPECTGSLPVRQNASGVGDLRQGVDTPP